MVITIGFQPINASSILASRSQTVRSDSVIDHRQQDEGGLAFVLVNQLFESSTFPNRNFHYRLNLGG
jgi:hypothetical protein